MKDSGSGIPASPDIQPKEAGLGCSRRLRGIELNQMYRASEPLQCKDMFTKHFFDVLGTYGCGLARVHRQPSPDC